jgi:general stress protein YciG
MGVHAREFGREGGEEQGGAVGHDEPIISDPRPHRLRDHYLGRKGNALTRVREISTVSRTPS